MQYKNEEIRNFQVVIIGTPDSPYALGFYRVGFRSSVDNNRFNVYND